LVKSIVRLSPRQALNPPLDAEQFVANLLRLSNKNNGWITLIPLDAESEPPNLAALKTELNALWPMTSWLDVVKETDLRLGFINKLKSPTSYETMDRSVLQPPLIAFPPQSWHQRLLLFSIFVASALTIR
jgi:hypothetical protein